MNQFSNLGFDERNHRSTDIRFSVVINTDNRLSYLKKTLAGLQYIRNVDFEVCVVSGPTSDGTKEFLAEFGNGIKVAHCPRRILSMSRNIGIAMSGGDVVCFIDDDSVPEPEWLSDLAVAYADDEVGAAGGFVYDNTGVRFQAQYVTTNRYGYPCAWIRPNPHMNFPFSVDYPHLLGTNCSFRKSALLEIGGFDEEFEYFLDETDVCCRINDAGYRIAQLPNAFVHHKYAPSTDRDDNKVVRSWYPLIKNRIYFGMRNGSGHHRKREIIDAGRVDARVWERAVLDGARLGIYSEAEVARFYDEMARAIEDGQARAAEPPKMLSAKTIAEYGMPFRSYSTLRPEVERFVICLVTQDYPPGQNGGIARNMSQLARSLAADGHHVHVLTRARGPATVDFEEGVWVHRVEIRHHPAPIPSPIAPHKVPAHIWSYGQTMLDQVRAIDARHKVDVVYSPLWDCEPIAFILDGRFPLIVALQTTMEFWLESQPLRAADTNWLKEFGFPILAMEEMILDRATMLHANSRAIVADIRHKYEAQLPEEKLFHSPHGMEDWAAGVEPSVREAEEVKLLFVGRLESRKGIDILLDAAPKILAQFPNAVLDIVGDHTIPRPQGSTYRDAFRKRRLPRGVAERIRFHGRVEEDELRQFYRDCDIFVAPSRYESFGLVFLEAMVFGKPVIAGNAGGGPEVVTHGRSGLLVEPGDAASLRDALRMLLADPELRERMGNEARREYEARFTDRTMMRDFMEAIARLGTRPGNAEKEEAGPVIWFDDAGAATLDLE